MSCPDPETLAEFADGLASDEGRASLQAHVDSCASCREVLVALARLSRPAVWSGATEGPDIPARGTAIGRYVVLEPRGSGGMGVVLAAYDDKLDRKVALKLLRPDLERGAQGTARMLREAQLMARVRHPNVVTVFDVGEFADQIFIAMELVEGRTLREWREAHPLAPWREVVELFVKAGRGLAAAHAAGVVHRDFKPDNVLLAANGQVLVSDFGLAWSEVSSPQSAAGPPGNERGRLVTRVGGTPAYMAPEQLQGALIDARADQFSFCVAFFEALYGERPFLALDSAGLLEAIKAGHTSPQTRPVPRALGDALRRGLAMKPEDRWPDLPALLAVLEKSLQRRGPLRLVAAGVVLGLAAGAFAITQRAAPCDPKHALDGVWDPLRRAETKRAFLATQLPFAEQVLHGVEQRFDAFAAQWQQSWQTSCEATKVHHTQSEAELARRMVCLDARLAEFSALCDLFVHADRTVVENAAFATERLRDVSACSDGEVLTVVAPPEGKQLEVAAVRLWVARANALNKAGKHAEALAAANEAVQRAQALHYRPVEAEAQLALGDEQRASGKFKEAEAALSAAQIAAEAGRDFESLARVCIEQILVVGSASMRPEEAEAWVQRAEGALEQMPRPELRAELDLATAVLRLAQLRHADAERAARKARGWYAEHHFVARAADASVILGEALGDLGQFADALTEIEAATDARTHLIGANHPLTLRARIQVAQAQLKAAHNADAIATIDALTEQLPLVPPFHRAVAWYTRSLALSGLGKDGVADARKCIEQISAAVGPGHRYTATGHESLAIALRQIGQLQSAKDEHARSLELFGSLQNAEVAAAHGSFAVTLLALEDPAAAQRHAQQAIEGFDALTSGQWVDRCPALWALAEAKRRLGQPDAAVATKAVGCVDARPSQPAERERAQKTLRALPSKPAAKPRKNCKQVLRPGEPSSRPSSLSGADIRTARDHDFSPALRLIDRLLRTRPIRLLSSVFDRPSRPASSARVDSTSCSRAVPIHRAAVARCTS